MTNWIFISNPNRFRMDDWLRVNQFIEFVQNNNVQVNDIVYLYTTSPVQRIEYKLIVDKINIPYFLKIFHHFTNIKLCILYINLIFCLFCPLFA